MVERKTIRPSEPVFNDLKDAKEESGKSWDEFFTALLEEETIEITLSSGSVDDIANAVDRRVSSTLDDKFSN